MWCCSTFATTINDISCSKKTEFLYLINGLETFEIEVKGKVCAPIFKIVFQIDSGCEGKSREMYLHREMWQLLMDLDFDAFFTVGVG